MLRADAQRHLLPRCGKRAGGRRGHAQEHPHAAHLDRVIERSGLDPNEIDLCVFGQVIPTVQAANIAREVVLASGLPRDIEAFSV